MIWHRIRSYLHHLWVAKGAFWLHSPFIFHLYTDVIRHRRSEAGQAIEDFRSTLSQSAQVIELLDLGAGKKNQGGGNYVMSLGDLASKVSRRPKVGELLNRLCAHFQPKHCLEFGTHLGISALYQLTGLSQEARFISMEGSPQLAALASKHLATFGFEAEVLIGDFDQLLQHTINWETFQPDYVFMDGNHQYAPTIRYFDYLLPRVADGSLIILDDIYWSTEMTSAWETIIQSPEVSVSIDLFHIGICFIRRPQAKEHFRLRF
ncbi:MAG: class I SAM-dependent methyltransferase [Bacteroidota bacterium]